MLILFVSLESNGINDEIHHVFLRQLYLRIQYDMGTIIPNVKGGMSLYVPTQIVYSMQPTKPNQTIFRRNK